MVSTYSDSRLSRLAGFIRSPFRAAPTPTPDPDWYVPYNGPIEQPRSSYAFPHDPFERGRSTISPSTISRSLQGEGSIRDAQSWVTSGTQRVPSSRRSSKSKGKAQPSFISLDTGGIGQSPAPVAIAAPLHRHTVSNRVQKEQSPPRDINVLHHPYNPHGMDSFTFPPQQSPSSGMHTSPFDPPSTFTVPEFRLEHPYSASVTSQAFPTSPVGDPFQRNKGLSGRPRAATARPDFAGSAKAPDQDRPQGRNRGEVRFEGREPSHPPISKSRSTPHNISQSARKEPSFSLPSHPYATSSSPKSTSGKPPIPIKSSNILRKLRTSTSAPNLFDQNASFTRQPKPLKLDSLPKFHPPVHEHPLSLSPESAILAVVDPRPRFVAAITEADDIPQSPYTLVRPPFVRYDSEPGVLSKCLPPFAKTKDTLTVPDLPKTADDLVTQFIEDNALLAAERAKWASRAENSFGNKRSRSLSNRSVHRQIRRSRSTNAISGTASREAEESLIIDVGTTHTHSSNAPSHQSSLKYIAAAAFGHGHSPKVSIDNSGGTSLSTWSSGVIPPVGVTSQQSHSHVSHSRTSSESKGQPGHKRKDSVRGVFEAVVGCVLPGAGESSPEYEQARGEPSPVLDVKMTASNPQISEAALAVEQRIGIALSTPPTTPEDQMHHPFAFTTSSTSLKAGPHPASPVAAVFSDYGDHVSKHRLPPQVHAHKRSLSAEKVPITLSPIQSPSSAKLSFSSSTPSRKESSAPSHPFAGAAIKDSRPPSGLVQASFEDAMIASTSATWFGRSDSGAISNLGNLGRLVTMEPSSPVPKDVGDDPESPATMTLVELPPEAEERRSPEPRPASRLGLYLTPVIHNAPRSPRSIRREGSVRRSLSLSEFAGTLRESERLPVHKRSSSEHVDYHSPYPDTLTPPQNDADSSLASSPRPDVLIGELDDLESFRDLFYRPQRSSALTAYTADSEVHRSATTSAFWEVVSPTLAGDGINLGVDPRPRSTVRNVPQDEPVSPSHSPGEGPLPVGFGGGSVYLGQIDISLPNIQGSPHRYSSTPVIEHSEDLEGAEIAQATHAHLARPQSFLLLPASTRADHSPTFPPATDPSGSDDGVRLSQFTNASTERMSNIILDFPPPPEVTSASAVALDPYFPNQSDDFEDIPQSRGVHPSFISELDAFPPEAELS